MKTFYEMMMIVEDDMSEKGQQGGQDVPQEEGPQDAPEGLGDEGSPNVAQDQGGKQEMKNYMFFSNLKIIKEKVEAMLAMDANQVDQMITDGHDWASDHISTSRDDVEEVYNWLSSAMGSNQQVGSAAGVQVSGSAEPEKNGI